MRTANIINILQMQVLQAPFKKKLQIYITELIKQENSEVQAKVED